jgi:hypothetical protein
MVRDALMVWDWPASSSRCAGRQWQRWLGIAPGHWATGHLGTVPKKSRLASATGNLAEAHDPGQCGQDALADVAGRTLWRNTIRGRLNPVARRSHRLQIGQVEPLK